MISALLLAVFLAAQAPSPTALRVEVRSEGAAVDAAEVVVSGQTHTTNADGIVSISVAPGPVEVTIAKEGFAPVTTTILVQPGQVQPLLVDLQPQPTVEEHITVSATRTDQRIEDVPMRIEVLDSEEIDEHVQMTPGDIVMMLNEMGGLRVQATSPSRVVDPVKVDETQYALENLREPTTTAGSELLATLKRAPFSGTASYVYVHSRELDGATQADVPLTPRYSVALVGIWEDEKVGRIGLECYYIDRQRLETNPFRQTSEPYVLFGVLLQHTFHRLHMFINGENLTNVHQTQWDPLIRASRAVDGRWTVDGWAPLDGRAINGGVRVEF